MCVALVIGVVFVVAFVLRNGATMSYMPDAVSFLRIYNKKFL
ncbi:MFS superfamily sulfate permease-like transporter [Glaciimonas immobilis]|uniref:MFS superfamily sulfate permease-like transporter n=1 Tax=Glaciimonas immobilis TaxID=728004 RepID=A0A840RT33_9BURK|nr:MFS superfamily sulfate permease-like transporter [Glaciimonas immobilis]